MTQPVLLIQRFSYPHWLFFHQRPFSICSPEVEHHAEAALAPARTFEVNHGFLAITRVGGYGQSDVHFFRTIWSATHKFIIIDKDDI